MNQLSKDELKDKMRKISALIGMYEIKRMRGEYISVKEIDRLRNEFGRLSRQYKKYFNLI